MLPQERRGLSKLIKYRPSPGFWEVGIFLNRYPLTEYTPLPEYIPFKNIYPLQELKTISENRQPLTE
jgi:hypothetical protein